MAALQQTTLRRCISRRDLIALTVNCVIGAGILGVPGKTFALLGSFSIAAWILCALLMALVALCFAEVGSRYSETGGVYVYAHDAFGPAVGFGVGWLAWVSRLFSFATIMNLGVNYLSGLYPSVATGTPRFIAITMACTALAIPLLIGARFSASVNNLITVCKLVLLIGFPLAMLPFFDFSQVESRPLPAPQAWQSAMLLMTFAFIGVEGIMVNTGEMRDPRRDAPFALVVGLAIIAFIYIAVQVACIATVPDLATSERPVIDAVTRAYGTLGGQLVIVAALVSMCGAMFAIQLIGSRLPFALAERGQLPQLVCRVHSRLSTPYVAIIVTCLLSWLLAVFSSFFAALTVSALTRLVGYVTTCAAVIVLRRRGIVAPFHLRAGVPIAIVGLGVCVWLIMSTTRPQLESVLLLIFIGAVIAIGCRMASYRSRKTGP